MCTVGWAVDCVCSYAACQDTTATVIDNTAVVCLQVLTPWYLLLWRPVHYVSFDDTKEHIRLPDDKDRRAVLKTNVWRAAHGFPTEVDIAEMHAGESCSSSWM